MPYSKKSTDLELVVGCKKGNRLAQKFLYERFYGQMMGITMRYAKDTEEACEILNSAFLKVFTNLNKYEDKSKLGGWIARIVFNTSIDYVRKHATYKKVMDFNAEKESSITNVGVDHLQAEDLYKLIQLLPTASQSVFSLYVIEGYKHREIAEILGITEGTSKWHLSNARKELKKMIENQQSIESIARA